MIHTCGYTSDEGKGTIGQRSHLRVCLLQHSLHLVSCHHEVLLDSLPGRHLLILQLLWLCRSARPVAQHGNLPTENVRRQPDVGRSLPLHDLQIRLRERNVSIIRQR